MKSIEVCPLCGDRQFNLLTTCIDHTVSHETFNIVNCTKCDFTLTSPRPADETLGRYYLSDNYISHSNKASTLLDKIYLLARRFTLQWKVNLLHKYHSGKKEVHILDYGCGTGEFLKSCQENGFKISGVEPSENARVKSSQINQVKIHESLEGLEDNTFNIITLWHVLEHIPNFEEIIQELKSKLSEDGTLIIAVPNYKSFDAQHYSTDWAGFDVPRHLWHFSSTTMKKLLLKSNLQLIHICGMKLDSYYVSLLSEKYRADNKTTVKGYLKAIQIGMKSNWKAKKNREYSSLIYIIKK
jgi:2-polyprenyl-3-methyl-5-hydroxy-6-metoxy-1,4-benzoquinol methylase